MPESPYPMIPVDEAIAIILREVHPLPAQSLPFTEAAGCVLAEPVRAGDPLPPFPASTVDGYALIAADRGPRRIVGDQMAGYVAGMRLSAGEAARVTTGAPVPSGADAVVMVEDTQEQDGLLTVNASLSAGDNIRPVGSDIAAGETVLEKGTLLRAAEIGLLATVGRAVVRVHPRPRVGVMSTGDEVVEPGQPLQPGQIRDANRYALMEAVRQAGGIPVDLGIVRDREDALARTIERGLAEADALLTSGGVSMGQLDLVKPYLARHGVLHFGRIRAKPGKPLTFGLLRGKPFFALPGNPVSALVTFEVFVRPALRQMAGHADLHHPRRPVTLAHAVRHHPDRTEFQRAIITPRADGTLTASTTGGQQSSRLLSLRGANGLLILPHSQGDFPAGAQVEAMLFDCL